MTSLTNLCSKAKTYLYKNYGENPGTMLVHTGVLGWILSAIAQVTAVLINDKISKKEKWFLIPQETADAFINIASFYIVTSSFKNVASKLVSTGKLSTKNIRNFIKEKGIDPAKYIGNINSNIGNDFPEIKKEYKNFKNGVDVVASTVGSIISCNIITPVLRNQYASKTQKDIMSKNKTQEETRFSKTPALSMDAYQKMASVKYSSGNLKI